MRTQLQTPVLCPALCTTGKKERKMNPTSAFTPGLGTIPKTLCVPYQKGDASGGTGSVPCSPLPLSFADKTLTNVLMRISRKPKLFRAYSASATASKGRCQSPARKAVPSLPSQPSPCPGISSFCPHQFYKKGSTTFAVFSQTPSLQLFGPAMSKGLTLFVLFIPESRRTKATPSPTNIAQGRLFHPLPLLIATVPLIATAHRTFTSQIMTCPLL